MKLVIDKFTKKGQKLQIFVDEDGNISAVLDGNNIGTGTGVYQIPPKMRPYPEYTHYTCEKVIITTDEANKLNALLEAIRDAKDADHEAKLAANVPGLDILRAALEDEGRYHRQFNRMMENEQNDGVNPPSPVKVRYNDVAEQYPRAAMYLKAESYSNASHYAKSGAGSKAMELIENGGDLSEAQHILDNWLPKEAWND
jgi:hypothetical protein